MPLLFKHEVILLFLLNFLLACYHHLNHGYMLLCVRFGSDSVPQYKQAIGPDLGPQDIVMRLNNNIVLSCMIGL